MYIERASIWYLTCGQSLTRIRWEEGSLVTGFHGFPVTKWCFPATKKGEEEAGCLLRLSRRSMDVRSSPETWTAAKCTLTVARRRNRRGREKRKGREERKRERESWPELMVEMKVDDGGDSAKRRRQGSRVKGTDGFTRKGKKMVSAFFFCTKLT